MKLRINGNSIRLRLNQLEFDAFMEFGSIADIIELPGGPVSYGLEKCGEDHLNVVRRGDSIRVGIPVELSERWKRPDVIGFDHEQTQNGKTIHILVEKELKCPTPEQCQADENAFERPESVSDGKD